ncbi:MAG: 1-(5-phosphoribosyl)-5-[(5-phosphoribosylamino)methylideneamino]imidazole-4-carboxamide isomerase [Bacteroidota bacterium]
MEIIPAIDIIDGQCVRLAQGDYAQKTTYHADPLEVAKSFESAGLRRLHLVDLDGAKAKKVVNLPVLQSIARETSLHIDFGGGVKATDQVEKVFAAGAKQVTGGSIAAKNKEVFTEWLGRFGGEQVILGADVLDRKIMVAGWQEATDLDLLKFLRHYVDIGLSYVICTDISKDGMLQGPALALYREILMEFPGLKLIASGGVSGLEDLYQLRDAGLYGAILGKAIYEKKVTLEELAEF